MIGAGAADAKKRRRARGSGYTGPNPCERLTEAAVGKALVITLKGAEAKQGSYAKEVCTVSWPKPNAEAIQQKMQQEMMASMKARMKAG